MSNEKEFPTPAPQEPKYNFRPWLIGGGILVILIVIVLLVIKIIPEKDPSLQVSDINKDSSEDGLVSQINSQAKGMIYLESLGQVSLGGELEVKALLDTGNRNINIAQVVVEYDPQTVKFIRFESTDSVLATAIREDSLDGKVEVSRGAPGDADSYDSDDGFTGESGLFGVFVFEVLSNDDIIFRLDQPTSKLLLDDGKASRLPIELKGLVVGVK